MVFYIQEMVTMKTAYLPRLIDNIVKIHLDTFGAVCIEGPKWCGKTWTSLQHSKSSIFLGDPTGGFQNKKIAELSPDLVLEGDTPRLIDEWQEVPSMWDSVRYEVDNRGVKGQFILTGSSTPQQKGIMHSGAGRISTIKMRPMSLYESKDSSGKISLKSLFDHTFSPVLIEQPKLIDITRLIVRGGWPGSLDLNQDQYKLATKEYINAIVNHDIYRLEGINRDSRKMILLLKSLARHESTTASISKIRKDILEYENETIDNDTISVYLSLFERMFLVENQSYFALNNRSSIRVKKSDKRHFIDPSLAVALLDLTEEGLINDLNTLGFLFEALCERDLRIYAENNSWELFHYQDYSNNEIDAVVKLNDGRWGAFEIKLGANQIDEAAKSLIKIKDKMKADGLVGPEVLAVVCGLSNSAHQRADGVYVIPISTLKP